MASATRGSALREEVEGGTEEVERRQRVGRLLPGDVGAERRVPELRITGSLRPPWADVHIGIGTEGVTRRETEIDVRSAFPGDCGADVEMLRPELDRGRAPALAETSGARVEDAPTEIEPGEELHQHTVIETQRVVERAD